MGKFLPTTLFVLATFSLIGCEPKQAENPVSAQPVPAPVSTTEPAAPTLKAHETFWIKLSLLCGKSYAGKLVSTDEADADMADKEMAMTVNCPDGSIRIPFAVGDDRSRTWVFNKTATGLNLSHHHKHEDGSEDLVSQYGGDTTTEGAATRQEFPADGFSVALFMLRDLEASVTNIWAVEVTHEMYAYELNREGRHFRVEFDLNTQINTPVIPW